MTVVAGCDPSAGLLSLHNFATDKNYKLEVCKIDKNDKTQINQFFEDIRKKITDKIDNLYVFVDYNYNNEFRKTFITVAKNSNIENIEIIGSYQSKLIGCITNLLKEPENGSMFWIFDIGEIEIFCDIWEFDEIFGWKFKGSCKQEKTFKENFAHPTSTDLLKLKLQISFENNQIKPFIHIFCVESTVARSDFTDIFPRDQNIVFHKKFEHQIWLRNYGMHLKKGKNLIRYKMDAVMERSIEIRADNEMICKIPNLKTLSCTRTAFTNGSESLLEIYEDDQCTMSLPLYEAMCVTLSVDKNGIYNGNLAVVEENVNMDAPLILDNKPKLFENDIVDDITLTPIKLPNNSFETNTFESKTTITLPNKTGEKSFEDSVIGLRTTLEYFTQKNSEKQHLQGRPSGDGILNDEVIQNEENSEASTLSQNSPNFDFEIIHETAETECQNRRMIYNIPIKLKNYDLDLDVIGIDLGTTECCAAIIRHYGAAFPDLEIMTGSRTISSYVAFNEKNPLCGKVVVEQMRTYANYSVYDTKRIIGKSFDEIKIDPLWPFNVKEAADGNVVIEVETFEGTDSKYPQEISAVLLSHIKTTTEKFKGNPMEEAVITIPSKFSEKQKEATKKAAEMAGFQTVHFIPEPVAAAFAYFMEIDIPNQSNILICDCGGGTTDICIARIEERMLEILNYDGDLYLGGRDFDKLLFNHFSDILVSKYGANLEINGKKYLLKQNCQDLKHTLSTTTKVLLDVNDYNEKIIDTICINRDEFVAMADDLLTRLKTVVQKAVNKSYLQFEEINYVFLVGGSCKMPMIKEMLNDIFPYAEHKCSLYPDWVVAHGAALYEYHLKSDMI